MVVKKGREAMFNFYDTFLSGHCGDYTGMVDKRALVRETWKILGDFMFKLEKIDSNNGCSLPDIEFPTIVYT